MDWLLTVGGVWLVSLGWLAGLAALFALLTRLWPCNPGRSWWADLRAARTDLGYWFVGPVVTNLGRAALLVLGVLAVYGGEPPADFPLRRLPLWVQCALVLLAQDVLMYWVHRAFHTRSGWRFHAVHHSPEHPDWLSAVRFHPVNSVLEFALADVAALLLGFSPTALLVLAPLNTVLSALVHANLDWTFGPFRYVIASPVFHRWHHTSEAAGRDTNFAPTFPFLDVLFGTFYMPEGERPARYGVDDPAFPAGFWRQWAYPFRGLGGWAAARPVPAVVLAALAVAAAVGGGYHLLAPAAPPVAVGEPTPTADEPAAPRTLPPVVGRRPTAVAVLPGGRVAVGAADGTLVLRDASTGAETPLRGHARRVNALAASRDGRRLASAGGDGTARVWDAATGEPVVTLGGDAGTLLGVAVSGDGRWLATGAVDGTVRLWDTADRSVRTLPTANGPVHAVAVSDGGRRVAAAHGREVTVWDAGTGRTAALRGHADLVYAVAVAPDGGRIVTGGYDGRVTVWDADAGEAVATLAENVGPVHAVAVTADGRITAAGADRLVRVWERPGGPAAVYAGGPDGVAAVACAAGRPTAAGRDGSLTAWEPGEADAGVRPAGAAEGR